MLTASKLVPAGKGLAGVLLRRAATMELPWDTRQKSRFEATDSTGRQIGIFLSRGTAVRGGDVLVVEDGSLIRVLAAPQPVMVVRHCPHHGSPFDLVRAAYHLGNRHVGLELQRDHLKLEPDPVLKEMLDRMHLIVTHEQLPFEPERGAYHGGHAEHSHAPPHADAHVQDSAHGHAHEAQHAPHVHGPACAHDHHHGHGHGHDRGHDHDHSHHGPEDHGHGHDHDGGAHPHRH